MRIIGLTGGVGAGKSTVLSFLEKEWGAYVIQADAVGHLVMEPEGECYAPVIALFGKEIIKEDKTIDRKRVSDVVFGQPDLLDKLNALVHPAVKRYILHELEEQKRKGRAISVVEAALLFEDNYQKFCDEVWYVHTDMETRIRRLKESRGYTREKALSIIDSQAPDEFFLEHADYVIENNGDLEETCRQVREGIRKNETL